MTTPMPTGDIVELIRGQERLEVKLDIFLKTQESMKTEFSKNQDSVKAEVEAIKVDIQAIKSANVSYKAYVQGAIAIVTIIWGGFTLFVLPILHRKLGLG